MTTGLPKSILTKSQTMDIEKEVGGTTYVLRLRYDDRWNNGHNTFSMTIDAYDEEEGEFFSVGPIYDIMGKVFPEYAKYAKWRACASDGPLHYIANTLYLAGDTDCEGLKKGEYRWWFKTVKAIPSNETVFKVYQWPAAKSKRLKGGNEKELKKLEEFCRKYEGDYVIEDVYPSFAKSKGKEPDLEAARESAIWEDATLEELSSKEKLIKRLPALMEEFKEAMEELGFVY